MWLPESAQRAVSRPQLLASIEDRREVFAHLHAEIPTQPSCQWFPVISQLASTWMRQWPAEWRSSGGGLDADWEITGQ
jgi:hypothetical protein